MSHFKAWLWVVVGMVILRIAGHFGWTDLNTSWQEHVAGAYFGAVMLFLHRMLFSRKP